MPASPARRLLVNAFDILDRESRSVYRNLVQTAGEFVLAVTVERDAFLVAFAHGRVAIEDDLNRRKGMPSFSTSDCALSSLLSGREQLLEMIRRDEVKIFGTLDQLDVLDQIFELFLKGAMRCPSMPDELDCYLDAVSEKEIVHANAL